MRTKALLPLSLLLSLSVIAAPPAHASSIYGFQGTYQDARLALDITVEHSSWMTRSGGGSSSRMSLRLKTIDPTVSGAAVTFRGSSRSLPSVAAGTYGSSAQFDLAGVKDPYLLDLHYQAKAATGGVMLYQCRLKLVQGRVRPGGMDKLTITVVPGARGSTSPFDHGGYRYVYDATRRWFAFFSPVGKKIANVVFFDNGPDPWSEGVRRIQDEQGRYGFMDKSQRLVVAPAYDYAVPFDGGFAKVAKDPVFRKVGEHTALVKATWGLVDRRGRLVVPIRYETLELKGKGVVEVTQAGRTETLRLPR
jgi:hypothetical protein